MRNLFDEDQPSEFDLLNGKSEDNVEQPTQRRRTTPPPPQNDYEDEIVDMFSGASESEVAYELEDEEMDVVGEAMVRLEQARLYDMLIKHNLFDGVQANPIALKNVQDELKSYIVERLQILLGIKQEQAPTPTSMRVELPFNKLEIQALKDLAYKLTKGATDKIQERETVEAVAERTEQTIKPLSQPKKPQGLKSLGSSQPIKKQAPPPAPPKKSNVVVNNTKKKKTVNIPKGNVIAPDGSVLSQEELEIAREQLENEMELGQSKHPYDMTPEELIERNKKIKGQTKSSKVRGLPMPSPDQMAIHYQQKQAERLSKDEGMTSILSRVLNQK
jgi:hypothetical protein